MKRYVGVALFFCVQGVNVFGSMKIEEHFVGCFSETEVPTEYYAYQELKKAPLATNVVYVAIPWYQLIEKDCLDKVSQLKIDGGFTICQHIWYKEIIPYLQNMGVKVLFAAHACEDERYGDLIVMPFPHYAITGVEPFGHKDILYSFVGAPTSHVRKKLFCMELSDDSCVITKRPKWHFWLSEEKRALFENEYKDILSRSRFSLCPRGTGPNTIRLWESLQAGAIPIIISDTLTLPQGIVNWHDCVIWIKQKEFLKNSSIIDRVVKEISPEQESRLRKNGLAAYRQFSGSNFVSAIRRFYGEL
jgi:hypothetical protein